MTVWRAPDAIEPIVAYRSWKLVRRPRGLALASLNRLLWRGADWHTAKCGRDVKAPHEAPMEGCLCGFYAVKDLRTLGSLRLLPRADATFVVGRVLIAGKVIEHDEGYRAERARVLDVLPGPGQEELASDLAAQFGVGIRRELVDRWDEMSRIQVPIRGCSNAVRPYYVSATAPDAGGARSPKHPHLAAMVEVPAVTAIVVIGCLFLILGILFGLGLQIGSLVASLGRHLRGGSPRELRSSRSR